MHLLLILLLACASDVHTQRIAKYSDDNIEQSAKYVVLHQSTGGTDKKTDTHNPKYQYQYDPRDDGAYRKYLWATIVGVVGGVFGLCVLIYQSHLTRESLKASHKSADAVMDSEMAILWISAREVRLRQDGRALLAVFNVHNIGRTAAIVFAGDHVFHMSEDEMAPPLPQIFDLTDEFSAPTSEAYFPPDADMPRKENGATDCIALFSTVENSPLGKRSEGSTFPPHQLTEDEWKAVRQEKKFLWCYGFVRYRDIFKRKFELRFCFQYAPNLAPEEGFVTRGPEQFNRLSPISSPQPVPVWRKAITWYVAQIESIKNGSTKNE